MTWVSRRDFGKSVSRGALGALAVVSVAPPASPQGEVSTEQSSPKRMTTVLRELIKSPGMVDSPSVYDPLTAKIAEMVGFRCITMPGSARGIVTCRIESTLTLDEVAAATQSITAVIGIPLLVDAGGGFGEPAHVFHTVRTLEHAGAAGVYIEDQFFPKRFHYYMDGKVDVISAQAMVEKIRYALQARRDREFVIGARTEATSTHGFAEGVRRANLYLAAGADFAMIFPRDVEETKQIPKEVRGPLNFVNAEQGLPGRPNFTAQELGAMGWKMLNHPAGAILMYYKTIKDAFVRLKETGSLGMDPAIYGSIGNEAYRAIDLTTYYDIEYWTSRLGWRGAPGTADPEFQPKDEK
jgi:2-methylisocitrate lyase-like PEP mutase family enzyme